MSQAFVEGRSRVKPAVPEGMVRLVFTGKRGPDGTRTFTRPIPFQIASLEEKDNPMVTDANGICYATEDEGHYLVGLGGGFAYAPLEAETPPRAPVMAEEPVYVEKAEPPTDPAPKPRFKGRFTKKAPQGDA